MNIWFTADPHFSHASIIEYSNRPFASVEEMDEVLIQKWNGVVRPKDFIWVVGDFSMKRPNRLMHIIRRLAGRKGLIGGNHDPRRSYEYMEAGFEDVCGVKVLHGILFTHFPVHPFSVGRYKANVHGHTHEKAGIPAAVKTDKKTGALRWIPYVSICVEKTDYRPIDFSEVQLRAYKAGREAGNVASTTGYHPSGKQVDDASSSGSPLIRSTANANPDSR